MKIPLLAVVLVGSATVILRVSSGQNGLLTLSAYLLTLASCILLLRHRRGPGAWTPRRPLPRSRVVAVAVLVLFQLAVARYFAGFPLHFHYDEFITAYASYSLPPLDRIDWFTGYPQKGDWVDQFPILFFVLQKPFLALLGPSLDAIRVSVWPYLVLMVILTYSLAREIWSRRFFPEVATLVAILFAPNVYVSSLGVTFTSGTACLLAGLYFYVRLVKTGGRGYAVLLGLAIGLSYLTYTGSYVILPLLILFAGVEVASRRSLAPIRRLLPAVPVALVVLLPFVVYAATNDNYFLQRLNQVNSISGSRAGGAGVFQDGSLSFEALGKALTTSVEVLYTPGLVGEVQSYNFGSQPLFTPIALALFVVGLVVAAFEGITRRRLVWLYVLASVLASFVFGMVLTVPAGSLHRLSVVYPLIGILIAAGLFGVTAVAERVTRGHHRLSALAPALLSIVLLAFVVTDLDGALKMAQRNMSPDSILIAEYLDTKVPASATVAIGAIPGYHLSRELFFRTGGRRLPETDFLPKILTSSDVEVFIALGNDDATVEQARNVYPDVVVVDTVAGVKLEKHLILLRSDRLASAGG